LWMCWSYKLKFVRRKNILMDSHFLWQIFSWKKKEPFLTSRLNKLILPSIQCSFLFTTTNLNKGAVQLQTHIS
jgi:hypothetical protein